MRKRQSKSGNARKIGRDLQKCANYRTNRTREKNKVTKLMKYLKKYPNDLQTLKVLVELGVEK